MTRPHAAHVALELTQAASVARRADLVVEPHGAELRVQELERDEAIVFEVAGEIHGGHATASNLTLDRVTVGDRRLQCD